MNVNMTLYEAGGYENLPRQLSQFDDCMAGGADAIIVGAISEAGLSKKFEEGIAAGKPVISTVNPVANAPTTAKMFVEFDTMGEQTGQYLLKSLGGKPAQVVTFPGPAGSGWAESFNDGFKKAIGGSEVKLLDEKFGDSGVAVQLQLIQDALQAYPDMNVIWGTAPTAEAAIGAVAEAGRQGEITIISSYENQAMLDAMNRGDILGFATQYPVLEGRVAIDMAVRALEGKPVIKFVKPIPDMISKETLSNVNMSLVLAPADWQPTYSVKAQ
jgi:protein TorT